MNYLFLKILINSAFWRKLQIYILIFGMVFLCGCSSIIKNRKDDISSIGSVIPIKGKEGTQHFIILGFGIVTVKKSEGETAVIATNTQALGINVSDQPGLKLGVGYSSSTVLTVPDAIRADDVRMEVSKHPLGTLKIKTYNSKLKDFSRKGGNNAER